MNQSAEKRKISRMRVDLLACIFWGRAENRSDVSIQNLSIHGISFHSKKYFARGTQFHFTLPHQMKKSGNQKISAEVVRCERSNSFSSDGRFSIGAKFLFHSLRSTKCKENSTHEILAPLQRMGSPVPLSNSQQGRLKNYPVQTYARGRLGASAFRIEMTEVNAEHIQSVRTPAEVETVYTRIQIKQARFVHSLSSSVLKTSGEPLNEKENNFPLTNLARPNNSLER